MFKRINSSALAVVGAAAIAVLPGISAAQQSLTVASWGGAYTNSQVEAYHKPYTAKTGTKITSVDWGGSLGEISAQVKSGNVKWDVVDLEAAEALKAALGMQLAELLALPVAELVTGRYRKYRAIGRFMEGAGADDPLGP